MDGQSKKRKLILDSDEQSQQFKQVEQEQAPISKKIHSENDPKDISKLQK